MDINNKIKILLVEDNPADAYLLKEILNDAESENTFHITHVEKLKDACESLKNTNYEIILLDLSLPDCNGIDTLLKLRASTHDIPIIVLTGMNDERLGILSIKSGAQDYFVKGFLDVKFLARSIRYATERHHLLMELEKAKKKELQISQQRYRTLAENTYDIISEIRASDGLFLYLSPNVKESTGYDAEELLGKTYREFINPEDNDVLNEIIKPDSNEIKFNGSVYRLKHKTEKYIWVESTGKSYMNSSGELSVVIISRDITIRRKMEEEMQKSSKLESLGILAGGFAHDFNNILMAIVGNVAVAKKRINDKDKVFELLQRIEKVSFKAKTLTEQLITFSKGGLPIKTPAVLNEIITNSTKFALTGSNILCNISIAENLWMAEVDANQISQVITNLIINSKQSVPAQNGIVEVKAENAKIENNERIGITEGMYVKISIIDNGSGISKDNINKIFDPYFTTKPESSGLGLTTAYSIIKNHGGAILVESEIDHGTTFEIYLPAYFKAAEPEKEHYTAAQAFDTKRKTIAIMDDDEMVLTPVSSMLNDMGYNVISAHDGNELIDIYNKKKADNKKIDIFIMDLIVCGGPGGKETIGKLLTLEPEAKAIVSSGYSNDPVMSDYEKFGFKGILAKPYQEDDIKKAIDRLL
ncbi:MAG: response regulator [Candidatus Wallbacteria bacterium]